MDAVLYIGRNRKERGKIMDKINRKILMFMIVYGMVCCLALCLFKTTFMFSFIPSRSMEGTLQKGDFVISTCYDVGEDDLNRYDILIFIPPDEPDAIYIKRLIGMPGETIEVSNGKVYADGVELDDSFIKEPMNTNGDGVYAVPDGCYFFIGDNRNNSKDSRFWEEKYVPLENIQAKAKFILFPFSDAGLL